MKNPRTRCEVDRRSEEPRSCVMEVEAVLDILVSHRSGVGSLLLDGEIRELCVSNASVFGDTFMLDVGWDGDRLLDEVEWVVDKKDVDEVNTLCAFGRCSTGWLGAAVAVGCRTVDLARKRESMVGRGAGDLSTSTAVLARNYKSAWTLSPNGPLTVSLACLSPSKTSRRFEVPRLDVRDGPPPETSLPAENDLAIDAVEAER